MKIPAFRRFALPSAAVAALLLTGSLPAAGQTPTSPAQPADQKAPAAPGVASAVGAITLPVTVVDEKGNPVKNLTPADLKLVDNGSIQTVQSLTPAATTPMSFGILGQTNPGLRTELGDMRISSVHFVDHTLPGTTNLFFVIQFANEVDLLVDPTKAQDKLHDAINQLGSPQFGAQNGTDNSDQGSANSHSGSGGTLYDAIYLASTEELKKLPGQHIIVIIGDGIDHDSKETMTDAVAAAQDAHASIFAIYYKSEEQNANPNQNSGHRSGGGGFPGGGGTGGGYPGGGGGMPGGGGGGGRHGGQNPSDQPHEDGKTNLEHICSQTGGYMIEGKRDKGDEAYAKLAALLKNQYTITFVPTKDAADSAFQHLTLTTEKKNVYPLVQEGYSAQQ
jgi:VWFA-related protein